jgi:ferredoxin/flavodoxin
MKGIVIYFSQTGNTKRVAEAIYGGMKSAGVETEITPISTGLGWRQTFLRDTDFNKITDYDLIALGTFVAHWGAPDNVAILEESLPDLSGKHCFLFATHGMARAQVFAQMAEKLRCKGLTVIGYKSWYGTCYIHWIPKPYFSDGHPDEIDLKEAADYGKEMVARSWSISRGKPGLIPEIPPSVKMNPPSTAVKLTYDKKKCNHPKCRLCMDYCPMGVIDLSVTPIVLQGEGCIDCHFCEKLCPTGAIDGNWESIVRSYQETLLQGALSDAEKGKAKGYYRPLVDFGKVMATEPWYKLTKRPRFRLSQMEKLVG